MPSLAAIIMRSKNEMPYVCTTLGMLQKQTFQDFELFAIDSGSTDGTLDELRKHCNAEHLSQINPGDYSPGQVLNEAIARTGHSIVVLLNADAVPRSEDWLEQLIQPILDDAADATFSRQIARADAHFIVAYDYQRAYTAEKAGDHFFSAAACAFKRELWERHKFYKDGYAEDAIWATACRMFNARFKLAPGSEVEHSHNYSTKELFLKRFRHGISFAKVHGETSPLGRRIYLCMRELGRDFLFACRQRQFRTIPYNIAYRITIHTGLHRGIREGFE
ncbi:MAG: glycosyltransferase family A protein [Verrucomicrobiota bacterium]